MKITRKMRMMTKRRRTKMMRIVIVVTMKIVNLQTIYSLLFYH